MKKLLLIAIIGAASVFSLTACDNASTKAGNEAVTEVSASAETSGTEEETKTEDTAAGETKTKESDATEETTEETVDESKPKGHPRANRNAGPKLNYDDLEHFEVQSSNLTDGVWDTKITNTVYGENISPELSWEPVENAACYQVYMIDVAWLHMDAVTAECGLTEGQIDGNDDNQYVGPYPPDGTHTYDVYVVALKNKPGDVKSYFNAAGNDIGEILYQLNTDEAGNEGNIISCGLISGTYTNGDR